MNYRWVWEGRILHFHPRLKSSRQSVFYTDQFFISLRKMLGIRNANSHCSYIIVPTAFVNSVFLLSFCWILHHILMPYPLSSSSLDCRDTRIVKVQSRQKTHVCPKLLFTTSHILCWGAGMVEWWDHSSPTNVAAVWFQSGAIYGLSLLLVPALLQGFFSGFSFPPTLHITQLLQICFQPG